MLKRGKRGAHRAVAALLLLLLFGLSPFSLYVPFVWAATPSPKAQQSELDNLIKRIETRYGRMRGLAADFEQTYSAPGVRTRRESGRLFLQRPRRMRWEYDPKPGKLFIVNGREVWFYIPADREATHAGAGQVADARFPFLFLLGNTNLRRAFRSITLIEGNNSSPDARYLRLVSRDNISGLREIFLEVFADGRISRIKIIDEAGAISEVSLTNMRENFIAPDEAFEFRPPPGVTVRRIK
ncbi:MAG: outer membrane lipoprotein carrier protein LolA [Acidobacteria bacterium]|nr:outer membrane lipoprotein carrier protein LolA [Acidobacteriota bacterium]